MVSVTTELEMAASNTFQSIVNQIQFSNLNFSIKMTPFAAYIILKKTVQKNLNGVHTIPAPPLLFLLQQAQEQLHRLEVENTKLKAAYDNVAHENQVLSASLEETNHTLDDLKTTKNILHDKLSNAEIEISKCNAEKTEYEYKLREHKKKHSEEMKVVQAEVKDLTKANKSREKEIHDLKRNLQNTRDSLKNCKAEKSQLKTNKTKLEAEIRNMGHRQKKEAEINKNSIKSEKIDINSNVTKPKALDHATITNHLTFFPTMVSHFNPNFLESSQRQANIASTVAHCVFTASNSDYNSSFNETPENRFKDVELEEKEEGFIGPRLPRILTEVEVKPLIRRVLGDKYGD